MACGDPLVQDVWAPCWVPYTGAAPGGHTFAPNAIPIPAPSPHHPVSITLYGFGAASQNQQTTPPVVKPAQTTWEHCTCAFTYKDSCVGCAKSLREEPANVIHLIAVTELMGTGSGDVNAVARAQVAREVFHWHLACALNMLLLTPPPPVDLADAIPRVAGGQCGKCGNVDYAYKFRDYYIKTYGP